MDFFKLAEDRFSVRQFKTEWVTPDDLEKSLRQPFYCPDILWMESNPIQCTAKEDLSMR